MPAQTCRLHSALRLFVIGSALKSPPFEALSPLYGLVRSSLRFFSRAAMVRLPLSSNLMALCFHGLANCFSRNPSHFRDICVAPRVPPLPLPFPLFVSAAVSSNLASPVLAAACRLFFSLSPLSCARSLCFQSFAASFCKTPGGGVSFDQKLRQPRSITAVSGGFLHNTAGALYPRSRLDREVSHV